MTRKGIPPPSSAKGVLLVWAPISIIASLLISSVLAVTLSPPRLGQLVWGELPPYFLAVFGFFLAYIAFRLYQTRPRYFYDEKGIYKGSRLLADWKSVGTMATKFRAIKRDLPAPVMPNFFSNADPTENAEFYPQERVDSSRYYFSFVDRDGREIARVPTRPAALSIGGTSEDLLETARAAGADITLS